MRRSCEQKFLSIEEIGTSTKHHDQFATRADKRKPGLVITDLLSIPH
jgi:hypothetical protein